MKKLIATLAAFAAIATATASAEIYPATFIVSHIDRYADVLTLRNPDGYTYEAFGIEDMEIGDLVSAIMDDVGTPQIFDDLILDWQYAGYFRELEK